MTCIVGLIESGKVYIGADSAGVSGLHIGIRKDPKVFKVGQFIIGATTSFRMIQLLMFSFKPPKVLNEKDIFQYMCVDFVNAVRKCFDDGGFSEQTNGKEESGNFLVGYKDRLFSIEPDYQVEELFSNYNAIGCGETYAKGALYMLVMDSVIKPERKVELALEVAAHFSAGVRPPYTILNT